ncbi:MAG: sulfatase-like hydrolase/transferase [Erysipelotrichaceae bacterium]|nr:sulfatase-like hydrolase/transferase [Erysipelotrichaceae bacterium]
MSIDINKIRNSDLANILILTVDQMRYDCLNSSLKEEDRFMITPNLDKLAQEGCTYTNCYSPNPVCIPARHNILTGLSAKHHGFDDNYFDIQKNIPFDIPTIGQVLSDASYDTIAIGKMHFQPALRHNGFNRLFDMDELPRYREDDSYAMFLKEKGYGNIQSIHGVRHLLYMQPQRSILPEKLHGNKWVADKTVEYLEENKGRRPFFIWSSWISPHPPFNAIDRLANLYKDKKLFPSYDSITPISNLAKENYNISDYTNEEVLQRSKELYCSTITHVDKNIKLILDKLEEINQLDNTLIIFMSDHGEMFGSNNTYQKFLPYDACSKVPFIVRYPKYFKANSINNNLITLNDIMPTLLDIANIKYPGKNKLPGKSLFDNDKQNYVYMEHAKGNRRWISIRDNQYKYNYYYSLGNEELFDLKNDPLEKTNLLYEPDLFSIDKAKNLKNVLIKYEEEYGLEGYVENGNLKVFDELPIHFYRETNFPYIYKNIVNEEEKENTNNMIDEIIEATKNEPLVKFEKLDLTTFKNVGNFSDEDIKRLLEVDIQRSKT